MPEVTEKFLSNVNTVMKAAVDYAEMSGGALSKLAEQEEKIAEAGPVVVDKLIKLGFLNENARADAIEATKDPLKVLESLQKTAETVQRQNKAAATQEVPVEELGKGSGAVKEAGESGQDTDNWGRRVSMEKAASNRRFLRTFMNSA